MDLLRSCISLSLLENAAYKIETLTISMGIGVIRTIFRIPLILRSTSLRSGAELERFDPILNFFQISTTQFDNFFMLSMLIKKTLTNR